MKLGDLITHIWQHGHSSPIHRGISYELSDGRTIGLNDLRAIWQYLNQDISGIESTIHEWRPEGENK